jgi:hypothetical protein
VVELTGKQNQKNLAILNINPYILQITIPRIMTIKKKLLVVLLVFLLLPSSLHLPVHILVVYAQGGGHTDESLEPLLNAIQYVYNTLASHGVAEISFESASDTIWKTTYTITRPQIIRVFGSEAEVLNRVRALVNALFSGFSSEVEKRLGAVLMIYKDRVIQDFPDLAGIDNGVDLWNAVLQKFGGSIIKAKDYVSSIATEQISKDILQPMSHTRTYDGVLRWITNSGAEYRVLVEWKSANDISETKNLLYSIKEAILDTAIVKTYSEARLIWIVYDYPPHQSELFRLLRTSEIGAFQNDMWLQETVFGYGDGMGLYEIIRAYLKTSDSEKIYSAMMEFVPSVKRAYMLAEQGKTRLKFKGVDYLALAGVGADVVASLWKPTDSTQAQIQQFLIKFSQATRITTDALVTAKGLGQLFAAAIGTGGSFAGGALTIGAVLVFYIYDYTRRESDFQDIYNQVLSGANGPKIYRISNTIYNGVYVELVGAETDNIALPRYLFIFVNGHLVKIAGVNEFTYTFRADDFGARIDVFGVHITLGRGSNYLTDAIYVEYNYINTRRNYIGNCYKDDRYLFTYTWSVQVSDVFFLTTPPVTTSSKYLGSSNLVCPPAPEPTSVTQPTGGGGRPSTIGVRRSDVFIIKIFGYNVTLPCYIDFFNVRIKMPYCQNS